MGPRGGMGPEANAPGKAQGYADGAPEEPKVEATSTSQTSVSTQVAPGMYDWQTRRWPTIERKVFKLQRRIYRASQRGDRTWWRCTGTVTTTSIVQPRSTQRQVSVPRMVPLRSRMSAKVSRTVLKTSRGSAPPAEFGVRLRAEPGRGIRPGKSALAHRRRWHVEAPGT
jgi:hypothetical protein